MTTHRMSDQLACALLGILIGGIGAAFLIKSAGIWAVVGVLLMLWGENVSRMGKR